MTDEKGKTERGAQTSSGVIAEKTPTPATQKAGFAPITADDEAANPVKVATPKTAQAIAQEGTALSEAGAEATGGDAPVLGEAEQPGPGKRIWSLDADHNVALRKGGPGSETNPDLVEFGS